jgi:hypothetical protein
VALIFNLSIVIRFWYWYKTSNNKQDEYKTTRLH